MAAEEGDEEEKKAYVDKRIAGLTIPKNAEEVVDCLKRWAQEGDPFSARRYAELLTEKKEYDLAYQYFRIACFCGMGAPQLSFCDHIDANKDTIGIVMSDWSATTHHDDTWANVSLMSLGLGNTATYNLVFEVPEGTVDGGRIVWSDLDLDVYGYVLDPTLEPA